MAHDLAFILPELSLAAAAMLALVAEMLRRAGLALLIALAGLATATLLTLPVLAAGTTVFGGTYRIDVLSGWAKLILLPATALSLLMARAELAGQEREGSVYAVICLVTLGALMLAGGGDMMLLVLGVTLTGLGSFALVAFPRDDAATEGAMKFLVFGAVSGAVMIYGLSLWFGGTGSTLYAGLAALEGRPLVAAAGLVAVIVGLGYKAALVPFQFWVPDAYQGAPVSVAGYLSAVTKTAALFALAQVLRDLPASTGWPLVLAAVAAATMTFGYLAALVQTDVVRFLAYSSVAQSGYFLLAIVAIGASPLAWPALIVFAAAYAAMNLGAFAIVLSAGRQILDFDGFGHQSPMAGAAMVVFLLSLTGVPPLFGFLGKLLLFGAAIEAGFLWLAVIGILNTVLRLAAYLRLVVPMYRLSADAASRRPAAPLVTGVYAVAALVTLLAVLFAGLPGR
jgi:proton-translocating NADH-quinone oxidoreductase chain N